MKKKPVMYSELCYFLALLLLAFGTALTERGGFGISMVVAPAYIMYLKLSQIYPWFSFGIAEYVLQAMVLVLMMVLLRQVRLTYFLSFATAVLYGLLLDGSMLLTGYLTQLPAILLYIVGVVLCAAGIAFFVETYLPPEAYELFMKKISKKYNIVFSKFKTVYDCCSCLLAIIMSLLLFGSFRGIGIGSVLCVFINGVLVGLCTKLYHRIWEFKDRFPMREFFEKGRKRYEQKIPFDHGAGH